MSTASHAPLTPLRSWNAPPRSSPTRRRSSTASATSPTRVRRRGHPDRARAAGRPGSARATESPTCCPTCPRCWWRTSRVPLAGAVLVAINTRLATRGDRATSATTPAPSCSSSTPSCARPSPGRRPTLRPSGRSSRSSTRPGHRRRRRQRRPLRRLAARGTDEPLPWTVDDEHALISINYTSGTTGRPKGVMYTHRGAYLNSLGEVHPLSMHSPTRVYLWTLPMFHCNGWCTPGP